MDSKDTIAAKASQLAETALADCEGSPALQRSVAELFAFAACIGSDGFAAELARNICKDMAQSTSTFRSGPLQTYTSALPCCCPGVLQCG